MNKFVQLSILLAALASGACKADDAGLCKPMCAEEKRSCHAIALQMTGYETGPKLAEGQKNTMAREFGNGPVRSNQVVGPEALDLARRKATRNSVCEDKYTSCTRACTSSATTSDVLVKPSAAGKNRGY